MAAVIAIGIAVMSLRESNALRRIALKEAHLDSAERRLEALRELAVLLHVFDEAAQNQRYKEAINSRETIRVLVKTHRFQAELPSVQPVIDADLNSPLAAINTALQAHAAISDVHKLLDIEAEHVHRLSSSVRSGG